ncbi:mycofactocin oligosaccharide methyltransferase MftM [Saccharopolyspora mangrovi]|uniref:Mycofactocin oligosaccharide methyltransferase MftM n=1 Tax=Saccharopolyspora mangrovi TaxID=3082379 RepID=A0ABU6AFT5_9PSEU|nr:mycofactocin oligosaccharide methyltransferase MftM [Saccharopolyspora sp. S2-29]MEB3370337.1 mycofactocin oligosaccharide methyltransferase MftM [Saccharopolyspora sp. S2-29]
MNAGERAALHHIDPLVPHGHDPLVTVGRHDSTCEARVKVAHTRHFCLHRRDHRMEITHWLRPEQLDNNLAGILAEELFAPGWLSGVEVFERVFTEVVQSVIEDPLRAWTTFYDNTLARIRECWSRPAGCAPHSSIADFAPLYRRVLGLAPPGRVLDLGSCFGFLPLLLAERGEHSVIASDLAPGSMRLLETVAATRGHRMHTLVCDAAQVPLPDGAVDTVTAMHLLEHLEPARGDAVLAEALRLARRRIIIAVPYEDRPNAAFGHVRTFTPADLDHLGATTGHPYEVTNHHGGWLEVHKAP